jgi:hypothetical protein
LSSLAVCYASIFALGSNLIFIFGNVFQLFS